MESESRYLKQATLIEARPISSTAIYLAWKGPIKHPGGIGYCIHLKKGSATLQQERNITGSISNAIVDGLEANMRYEVCVRVVDQHYKTTRSACNDVVVITTPAQLGKYSCLFFIYSSCICVDVIDYLRSGHTTVAQRLTHTQTH